MPRLAILWIATLALLTLLLTVLLLSVLLLSVLLLTVLLLSVLLLSVLLLSVLLLSVLLLSVWLLSVLRLAILLLLTFLRILSLLAHPLHDAINGITVFAPVTGDRLVALPFLGSFTRLSVCATAALSTRILGGGALVAGSFTSLLRRPLVAVRPLIARPAGLRGRFVCHLLRLGRRLVVVLLPLPRSTCIVGRLSFRIALLRPPALPRIARLTRIARVT